jgi:hypothetical protein
MATATKKVRGAAALDRTSLVVVARHLSASASLIAGRVVSALGGRRSDAWLALEHVRLDDRLVRLG